MNKKTSLIILILLGCYPIHAYEKHPLILDLPLSFNKVQSKANNFKIVDTNIRQKFPESSSTPDFFTLSSTKNSKLKAVIKRKTYGLRYIKTW